MKKTKIIAILLSLCLVLGLAGCASGGTGESDDNSGEGTTPSGTATSIVEDKDADYHMFVHYAGYSFWQECYRGFEDAANVMGVTAVYSGTPETELNAVLTAFNSLVAQQPHGIAVTCMDADAYVGPINDAIDAGVNIVVFDSDSPNSNRLAFIGTENYNCGVQGARFIGEALGGEGKVGMITSLTQANIVQRNIGFSDTMDAEYPNIEYEIIGSATEETETIRAVQSLLQVNPDIEYLFPTSYGACTATQAAVAELGLTDQIKIITFDTDEPTLDAIENGTIEASISQSPYCMGWWSLMYLYFLDHDELVSAAENWKDNGYPFLPPTADSGSVLVTADNAYMFRKGSENEE